MVDSFAPSEQDHWLTVGQTFIPQCTMEKYFRSFHINFKLAYQSEFKYERQICQTTGNIVALYNALSSLRSRRSTVGDDRE